MEIGHFWLELSYLEYQLMTNNKPKNELTSNKLVKGHLKYTIIYLLRH